MREDEDSTFGESYEEVKRYWKKMMDEHGTAQRYLENLISRFKNQEAPEIMIVVDKLLTGFDEKKVVVMYLDRILREHTLLQAVTRVNRVCDGKQFGYVIDYYGVIKEAMDNYTDYDEEDLRMFLKLRASVQARYSDTVDYKQYEVQIQKLINRHVSSGQVEIITDLVNIFDPDKFEAEIEKTVGAAAKADTIASRTAKFINENMDSDPAFYKRFSRLIEDTIKAYEQNRTDEVEYLRRVMEYKENVLNHTKAFYNLLSQEMPHWERWKMRLEKALI